MVANRVLRGGMRIAPGASPTDGPLDVVILGDICRVEPIRWIPTLYSGRHLEHRKVKVYTGQTVTITSRRGQRRAAPPGRGGVVPT